MAVDASAVARVLGISTQFRNLRTQQVLFLPQRIAVVGQGNTASTYALDRSQVTSALEVGQTYGFGSPLHRMVAELLPSNGDGVGTVPVTVYPLEDHGSGVAAAGDITPAGTATATGTYRARIGGVESQAFTLATGDTVADAVAALTSAINGTLDMPVLAVDNASASCDLTAKWAGETGNDVAIEIIGPSLGITFAVSAMASGATNPDITTALARVGETWETMFLNGLGMSDSTALDAFQTWNEGRWQATAAKPAVVFAGETDAVLATATATTAARNTDRTNVQLVAPGSDEPPWAVAARQVSRIARRANNNPAHGYGGLIATGIEPGADDEQWTYTQRDVAVKAGSSTVEVVDGQVKIGDVVTMYAPTGDPDPAYRYVVDIVKLQNIIYNLALIFAADDWADAPLIPDDQPTTNPTAKKPRMAVAAVNATLDGLGLAAIISDTASAKEATTATIDAQNAKRINIGVTVALSGNTNIKSVDLNFGFFYGAVAA